MIKTIALVFGGVSVEHEISILSAMQVLAAMPKQYHVIPIYIAKDGHFYSDPSFCDVSIFTDLSRVCTTNKEVQLVRIKQQVYLVHLRKYLYQKKEAIDFVFPILHGTYGEDGCFQGYLETLHLPYAQGKVLAMAVGQDKQIMKCLLQDAGLPVVPWFSYRKGEAMKEAFYQKVNRLGYPIMIKPAHLGSSIGIQIVHYADDLKKAMEEALMYDSCLVIEKKIEQMEEYNISVLCNEQATTCSVIEKVMRHGDLLTFEDKYESRTKTKVASNAYRTIPAHISKQQEEEIKEYAIETCLALQAEGIVRIDFLYDVKSDTCYVNEINSIPGSMAYYLWEASGVTFTQVLESCIQMGLNRWKQEQALIHTFDNNVLQHHQGIKK